MKKTALITGASSGIGMELARIHARKNGDLVLVARRLDELETLKSELVEKYKVKVWVFQQDLTRVDAAENVYAFTQKEGVQVDYLFNNAGFGGHGFFVDRPIEKDIEMINLNVSALVKLSHLFLQDMKKRKSGKILNTASTAGFFPGPLQATYFATKAFVVSFSEALAHELKPHNISVTALCPGPVKTEFEKTAGMTGGNLFEKAASAKSTAEKGYRAMEKGKVICISEPILNVLIRFVMPFFPKFLIPGMVQKMQTI
ncbi:MAG: SDR family oxidoreductase [Flavobacteriales bacterium]|nr:SDR family oxidoreductase [Flavobacteriales bacterium]